MPTIPFIEARFLDQSESRFELESRLKRHLRLLRCRKLPPSLMAPPDDVLDGIDNTDRSLCWGSLDSPPMMRSASVGGRRAAGQAYSRTSQGRVRHRAPQIR